MKKNNSCWFYLFAVDFVISISRYLLLLFSMFASAFIASGFLRLSATWKILWVWMHDRIRLMAVSKLPFTFQSFSNDFQASLVADSQWEQLFRHRAVKCSRIINTDGIQVNRMPMAQYEMHMQMNGNPGDESAEYKCKMPTNTRSNMSCVCV